MTSKHEISRGMRRTSSRWTRALAPVASLATLMFVLPLGLVATEASAQGLRGATGLIAKPRAVAVVSNGRAVTQAAAENDLLEGDALHARQRSRAQAALAASGLAGLRVVQPVGRDMQRLDFDRPASAREVSQAIERLMATGAFEWVEPNVREQRQQVAPPPNDPFFNQQWWLAPAGSGSNRGVPGFQAAWTRDTGAGAPPVAVLDTGIVKGANRHPDLPDSQVLAGYDLVSEAPFAGDGNGRDADPADPGDFLTTAEFANEPFRSECAGPVPVSSSWHGTIIAGIVAAATNNGVGVAAAVPRGRVLPVRVAGKCGATVGDIIDGMRWAAGLSVAGLPTNPTPAGVVNISYGSFNTCGDAYQQTIDELARRGVVVVAAVGNDGGAGVIRPANCRGVVSVAAVNREGYKTPYSNVGTGITVSAPGGDPRGQGVNGNALGDDGVVSVNNEGSTGPGASGYAGHFGTSFSTPIVSAAVALMQSRNPDLSVNQVINGLRATVRPHVAQGGLPTCGSGSDDRCNCTTATCGAGLLDVPAALNYAENTDGERNNGGGGGSMGGGGWLAGLALAVWALRRRSLRDSGR